LAPERSQKEGGKVEESAFPDPEIEAFGSWKAVRKRRERGEK